MSRGWRRRLRWVGLPLLLTRALAAAAPATPSAAFEAAYMDLVRLGKSLSAVALAERTLRSSEAAADGTLAVTVHLVLARDLWNAIGNEASRSHACSALELLKQSARSDSEDVRLPYASALCNWRDNSQLGEVMKQALAAVAAAKARGNAADSIHALTLAARVAMASANWALAEHYAGLAGRVDGVPPDNYARLIALREHAWVLSALGRKNEALKLLDEVQDAAQASGDLDSHANAQVVRSTLHADLKDALPEHLKYVALLERFEDQRKLVVALLNLSDLQMRSGQPEPALASADRALAILDRRQLGAELYSSVRFNKGWALNRLGQHDEGLALISSAVEEDPWSSGAAATEFAFAGRYREAYEHLKAFNAKLSARSEATTGVEKTVNDDRVEHLARVEAESQLARAHQQQLLGLAISAGLLAAAISLGLILRQRLIKRHAHHLALMNQKLETLSQTDALTGLHNRHHFMAQIGQHVAAADRSHSSGAPAAERTELTFFVIDLDFFKRVNDELGHAAGDEVLRQAAVRLASLVRSEDELVRWGGEEFLLMTRGRGLSGAPALAERIRSAIADTPFHISSGPLAVTCSIGFASYPAAPGAIGAPDWQGVVELADQALYRVKEHGRNGWSGVSVMLEPLKSINVKTLAAGLASGTIQTFDSFASRGASEGAQHPG